jgi:hypothetical protein
MSVKKNKSSIKYGNYIYNELKGKKKTKNTYSSNNPIETNFLTVLGTMINEYRKYFLPVFTLGGYPIDDSAYDRNTNIIRKSLKEYFDYSNTTIDYSYYDVNDDDLEDYFLLCQAQDEIIKESFSDYVVTDDELLNSICGLDSTFLEELDAAYNSIPNNPYTIT